MSGLATREVLIPLVDSRGAGALCHVSGDENLPPPHPAQLDRMLSDLFDIGLYQVGQQAKAAVRRLQLRQNPFGLASQPVTLSVINPGDVAGLAPENSVSAGLGLALALLMYASQSAERRVIATGALEAQMTDPDVHVRPIHHLSNKFDLVLRTFRHPGVASPPMLFFTPELDPDNVRVSWRYESQLLSLQELGITVVPVSSLRAAARRLSALRPVRSRRLRRATRLLAGLGLPTMVAAASLVAMDDRTIPLRFTSVTADDGSILPSEPFRMHEDPDQRIRFLLPCIGVGRDLPAFSIGDDIAAHVQVGTTEPTGGLAIYKQILVTYSSVTGPKIILLRNENASAGPGQVIEFRVEIKEVADEETLLVLLSRRYFSFNPERIEKGLRERLNNVPEPQRMNVAGNYLRSLAPGALNYSFRSVEKGSELCR